MDPQTEFTVGQTPDADLVLLKGQPDVEPALDGRERQELWRALDAWFEERLAGRPQPSFKEETRA